MKNQVNNLEKELEQSIDKVFDLYSDNENEIDTTTTDKFGIWFMIFLIAISLVLGILMW